MPLDLPFETPVVARPREVALQRVAGAGLADCNQEPRLRVVCPSPEIRLTAFLAPRLRWRYHREYSKCMHRCAKRLRARGVATNFALSN